MYVDNLLIMLKCLEEHSEQLEPTLSHFKAFGVTIELKKLEFLKDRVSFLRCTISDKRTTADKITFCRI